MITNGPALLRPPGFWIFDPEDRSVLAKGGTSWTWHSIHALEFETRDAALRHLDAVRIYAPRAVVVDAKTGVPDGSG